MNVKLSKCGMDYGGCPWGSFVRKDMTDAEFKNLKDFSVHCEYIEQTKGTTPTGYLRKKGWHMPMSFNEKIGGVNTLKQFQYYAKALTKKYKKRAFSYFKKTHPPEGMSIWNIPEQTYAVIPCTVPTIK